MSIPGRIVRLRAVEETDLPQLHHWANDEQLWSGMGGWRFPSSLASAQAWFAGLKSDALNHRWIIETLDGDQAIGTANLVDLDWKNRHATHGMMLGAQTVQGKGYGRDVVMAVMRYAFDELGLERLDGDIIEFNAASYRLYVEKCGWREEGRQRRWHYRRGRFWDRIVVGVTREDYVALAQSTAYWDADR
jgi:RimJ/RimL family protein N-acetyltransferase